MPVTAKLWGKFYEKLGDDIATEPVELFKSGGRHVPDGTAGAEPG